MSEEQGFERVFVTPAWVSAPRQRAGQVGQRVAPVVPAQAAPTHDQTAPSPPPVAPRPRAARPVEQHVWKSRSRGRVFLSVVLLACLAGSAAGVVMVARDHQTWAFAVTLTCLVVAVVAFAMMAADRPLVVEVSGTSMTLTNRGGIHFVDLADPFQAVRLEGSPGHRSWRLEVVTPDGDAVTIGPRDVDASVLHPIVERARAVADDYERRRRRRFSL